MRAITALCPRPRAERCGANLPAEPIARVLGAWHICAMRRAAVSLILVAVALSAPASAQAQAPVPVQTTLNLSLERVGGKQLTALVGDRIRVRGAVAANVPGESITVSFIRRGRKVRSVQAPLQPAPEGGAFFVVKYSPPRAGRLVVQADHPATPALGALSAKSSAVDVLPRRVGSGSGSTSIRSLQNRLAKLGYVVGRRGRFDARTRRAVLAFRKVTGMARTKQASEKLMRKIARGGGRFPIRFAGHGRHMEADISRQVLVLIDGGKVRRIYPVSSGKPGTPTVLGSFRVYSKTPGTNAKGMVHSAYFIRGYATHGYASVPIYPASHGCIRVPIPEARRLFDWVRVGTPVDTYR